MILHGIQPMLLSRIVLYVDILGRHVAALHLGACLQPRTAGIVDVEDAEQARSVPLEELDEAVAKHCVGSFDHLHL